MQKQLLKLLMILSLGLVAMQLGVTGASAQEVGKKKDYTTDLNLPYGIEKKYNFVEGTGYVTEKNVASKFQSQVDAWNKDYVDSLPCQTNCSEPPQNSATAIVVCPTSLTDEEMRLCLGLPAVKKAVRVKRLNVQLGQAQ